jgi:hypothetical protein
MTNFLGFCRLVARDYARAYVIFIGAACVAVFAGNVGNLDGRLLSATIAIPAVTAALFILIPAIKLAFGLYVTKTTWRTFMSMNPEEAHELALRITRTLDG